MLEIANYFIPSIGQSHLKKPLIDAGVISDWLDVAKEISSHDELSIKLLSF